MDWKIELVAIPVTDVDRAKAFYTEKVGFNADHDHRISDEVRFVQLTPPGSACSIALGTGISQSQPGSVQGIQMVVSDIMAARAELLERGCKSARSRSSPGARLSSSAIRMETAGLCNRFPLATSGAAQATMPRQ
jgi:predicted enzyme related to lactoylglutathione lyase